MKDSAKTSIPANTPALAVPSLGINKAILQKLDQGPSSAFTMKKWNNLQQKQPEIAQFISAVSYRLSPDEPEERAKIAAGMISIYTVLLNAKLQADVMQSVGQSLEKYFKS